MSLLFATLAAILPVTGPAIPDQAVTVMVDARAARERSWGEEDYYRGRRSVRTFEAPEFDGFPLDICPRDVGVEGLMRGRCGISVANEFCRARGFDEASDAPHEGGIGPTRQLSGAIVSHPWATSFRYITCVR